MGGRTDIGTVIVVNLALLVSAATAPVVSGVVAAVVVLTVAIIASGSIPTEFYAVAAQVIPVFLVALVVEQRVLDRFERDESEDARRAQKAWQHYPDRGSEPPNDPAAAYEDWNAEYGDYWWAAGKSDMRSVAVEARRRYRRAVALQAATVMTAVLMMIVGEATAVIGVLIDGTTADYIVFPITITTLAGSFTMIVVSALGELVRGAFPVGELLRGC